MEKLTGTNEKTIFVVYNEEKYNNTGETEIIYKGDIFYHVNKLCKMNKSLNYSTYPPYTYNQNKS